MTLEETRKLCDFVKSRADEALAALEHIYRAVDLHDLEAAEAEDKRQTVLPFVRRAA